MAGSTFGTLFRVTTAGESHGSGYVTIIDGVPAGLPLTREMIQTELDRRKPGGHLSSPRQEPDQVEIASGVFEDITLGTPIVLLVKNNDARSQDYPDATVLRPGHADAVYELKYGYRDHRGGGRASGRETLCRVAGGAIAKQILTHLYGTTFHTSATRIHNIERDPNIDLKEQDLNFTKKTNALIEQMMQDGDSVGGEMGLVIDSVPPGLGEPVFDRLDALLAHAFLSIPSVIGCRFGTDRSRLLGSEANDPFVSTTETTTNHHGGILGGISSGMPLRAFVTFKAPSSIALPQSTVRVDGTPTTVTVRGRHDACIIPRALVVVEAMAALVLVDLLMQQRASTMLLK